MEKHSWNLKSVKRSRSESLSSSDSKDEWLDDTWYTYSTNTDSYHPLDEKSLRLLNVDSHDMPELSHDSDDSIENYSESSHDDVCSIKSSPGSSRDVVYSIESSPGSSHNDDVYPSESSLRKDKLDTQLENTDIKNIVIKKEKSERGYNGENNSSNTDNGSTNWIKTIKQINYDNHRTVSPGTSLCTGTNMLLKKEIKSLNFTNKRHIVTVLIPNSETKSITEALILLGAQNLGLNTEQWTVVDDKSNRLTRIGEIVAFAIDQPSFIALCAKNFTASMGFKKLHFRVKKHVDVH